MPGAEEANVGGKNERHVPTNGLTGSSSGRPEDFILDIVFVHGLGGHPFRTWASKSPDPKSQGPNQTQSRESVRLDQTERPKIANRSFTALFKKKQSNVHNAEKLGPSRGSKAVYWPRDFLARDFPSANVMTWGYNSNLTKGYSAASQGTVFSHARNLLYSLVSARRGAPERPLVFIAHSLGGILVKKVLRRSEFDIAHEVRQILLSTSAVMFYGTPHRGSPDWASFGELVARIVTSLTGIETNSKLIRCLLPSGSELEQCRESFARRWQARQDSLTVRTYQEGRGPSGIRLGGLNKKVVPDESSSLDHPSQWLRTIDADHRKMCRFATHDEQGYLWIKADVQYFVDRASSDNSILASKREQPAEIEALTDISRRSPDQRVDSGVTLRFQTSINSYSTSFVRAKAHLRHLTGMEVEQHLFETDEPVGSTFRWVLQNPHYLRLDDSRTKGPYLLHITGKPGCGKTTLAAFVYRQQNDSKKECRGPSHTLFFAFNARREGRREPVNLLAALILQLLEIGVDIPSDLRKHWDDKAFKTDRWTTFTDLHWAFSTIVSSLSSSTVVGRLVLVVDALDECIVGNDRNTLLNTIRNLVEPGSSHLGFGVIITSRPYADISFSGTSCYKLDLNLDDNADRGFGSLHRRQDCSFDQTPACIWDLYCRNPTQAGHAG